MDSSIANPAQMPQSALRMSSSSRKSRRVVSLDSSSYGDNDAGKSEMRNSAAAFKSLKSQSFSAIDSSHSGFMVPLSFEEVDLKSTPLSSLRSCSEFQRKQSNSAFAQRLDRSEKRGTVSRIFSSIFNFGKKGLARKKMRGVDDDEKMYFVQNMTSRGDDAYDFQGEEISSTVDLHRNGSNCFPAPYRANEPPPKFVSNQHRRSIEEISKVENRQFRRQRQRSIETDNISVMHETSAALDMLFGFRTDTKHWPMEIELKTIKSENVDTQYGPFDARLDSHDSRDVRDDMPWVPRALSFDRRSDDSADQVNSTPMNAVAVFAARDVATWAPAAEELYLRFLAHCRTSLRDDLADETYYEMLRLQPFTFGSYLRGLLWAGYSSLFFSLYSLSSWPAISPVDRISQCLSYCLYGYLLFQCVVHMVQLPARICLHLQCWESSRTVDVEAALSMLRRMIQCDAWVLNRSMGRLTDAAAVLALIFGECYLHFSVPKDIAEDPVRGIIVSLCATNLYYFVVRIVVCVAFSLSCHDPAVLSEARKRGLSRLDLEVLPTFVFSDASEVNNHDCSICLCNFDRGEMLISLPCDKKHSFHACCIRQWLQRQNSCPLCQRLV